MTNQKGFTAVEGVLLLVIIGILSFTGWFVWHSQQSTNKTNSQAAADSSPAMQTKKNVPAPANLTVLSLKSSGLKFKYDSSVWKVENNTADTNQCGKTDTATMQNLKISKIEMSFSLGNCGKGGGICFDEANSGCIAQSKLLDTVKLSDKQTAYVLAHRSTIDNGKTWSYDIWLSDKNVCKSGLCSINIPSLTSNPGLITGFYGNGEDSWPSYPKSLDDFVKLPDVMAMETVLKTAQY